MGTAMAYALTQPLLPSLLVFTALGAGMAAPFLLAAAVPGLLGWMPKPGAWMLTFRQLLGWPMLATALWLLYVFTNQTSVWATFVLLTGLMLLSFTLWLYGAAPRFWKALLILVAVATTLLGVHAARQQPLATWQPWSPAAVEDAREEQPVFVDFTADWCITCKVTELTVLNTDTVTSLFAQHNVLFLKADWTRQDPAITQELARHGRKGVPLYLLYRPGEGAPQILPQLITAGTLEQALNAPARPTPE
jgi:thiol:disulfide interchange protein DsbD